MKSEKSRRRGSRKRIVNTAVMAVAVIVLFLWGIVALAAIFNGHKLPPVEGGSSAAASASGESTAPAGTTRPTEREPGTTSPNSQPDYTAPTTPGATIAGTDNAYFDDAVFIGDSRTEGLMLYGSLHNATFYTHKGLMVNTIFTKESVKEAGSDKKITIMQALEKHKFGKVYVMLGVNELGWVYEKVFIQRYGELVDEIKRLQPDAVIYIQSIMPVSQAKSDSGDVYTNDRIRLYNSLIVKMCEEKGVHYLNVAEAVEDDKGVLPAEATTDGIHLKPAYCVKWREYLKSHTL